MDYHKLTESDMTGPNLPPKDKEFEGMDDKKSGRGSHMTSLSATSTGADQCFEAAAVL